ncbi:MAG TPA: hypothetical protein VJ022_05490, partial [Anaerolineales bacterium]|nr:hypothetical protein [Anaerolineales bacterium]
GLHITEAITANKDLLIAFGGHPMAAGISLKKENLTAFRKGLGRAVEIQLGATIREEPTLQVDAWLGLDEINLELASALETMAPFGAGNPPLVLASRGLTLKSFAEIGKARDHRKLIVEDEHGSTQEILWWSGAGEELPQGKFDLAFSLRANTFRGEKRIQVQLEEFRLLEEQAVEILPSAIVIKDFRLESASRLANLQEQAPALQIWAEGADTAKGKSRFELQRSDQLAIYTTPSSPTDLHAVLEIVKPEIVYLFAVAPIHEKTNEFLSRLAGMAKYAVNKRGGRVSIQGLAVATAQRESAIRIGLEWLAAGGHVSISGEGEAVVLAEGNREANQYLQRELFLAVKGVLEETAAYREYIQRATAESILAGKY